MPFEIEIAEGADEELAALRVFDQRRITETIEVQLTHQPTQPSRNRKMVGENLTTGFQFKPPLWELKAGLYRLFYDVDETAQNVFIRAVRKKPPHRTTQEIVHEKDSS